VPFWLAGASVGPVPALLMDLPVGSFVILASLGAAIILVRRDEGGGGLRPGMPSLWQSLFLVATRVLMARLYSNTGQSVLAAVLVHATSNLSVALCPVNGSHHDPAVTGCIATVAAACFTLPWWPPGGGALHLVTGTTEDEVRDDRDRSKRQHRQSPQAAKALAVPVACVRPDPQKEDDRGNPERHDEEPFHCVTPARSPP